jgi:hypothetical protein
LQRTGSRCRQRSRVSTSPWQSANQMWRPRHLPPLKNLNQGKASSARECQFASRKTTHARRLGDVVWWCMSDNCLRRFSQTVRPSDVVLLASLFTGNRVDPPPHLIRSGLSCLRPSSAAWCVHICLVVCRLTGPIAVVPPSPFQASHRCRLLQHQKLNVKVEIHNGRELTQGKPA